MPLATPPVTPIQAKYAKRSTTPKAPTTPPPAPAPPDNGTGLPTQPSLLGPAPWDPVHSIPGDNARPDGSVGWQPGPMDMSGINTARPQSQSVAWQAQDKINTGLTSQADQYKAWITGQQSDLADRSTNQRQLAGDVGSMDAAELQRQAQLGIGNNAELLFRNGLDQYGNHLDRTAIQGHQGLNNDQYARDMGFTQDKWTLKTGQMMSDQDYITGLFGRANAALRTDNTYYDAQKVNLAADRDLGLGQAGWQYGVQRQGATSDATAKGALMSQGYGTNLGNIGTQRSLAEQGAQNQYNQGMALNTHRQQSARDAYDSQWASLQKQQGDVERRYQGDEMDWHKQQADLTTAHQSQGIDFKSALDHNALADQSLKSLARQYGMKDEDLHKSLEYAINRNGLNTSQVIAKINEAEASGNQQLHAQMVDFLTALLNQPQHP